MIRSEDRVPPFVPGSNLNRSENRSGELPDSGASKSHVSNTFPDKEQIRADNGGNGSRYSTHQRGPYNSRSFQNERRFSNVTFRNPQRYYHSTPRFTPRHPPLRRQPRYFEQNQSAVSNHEDHRDNMVNFSSYPGQVGKNRTRLNQAPPNEVLDNILSHQQVKPTGNMSIEEIGFAIAEESRGILEMERLLEMRERERRDLLERYSSMLAATYPRVNSKHIRWERPPSVRYNQRFYAYRSTSSSQLPYMGRFKIQR